VTWEVQTVSILGKPRESCPHLSPHMGGKVCQRRGQMNAGWEMEVWPLVPSSELTWLHYHLMTSVPWFSHLQNGSHWPFTGSQAPLYQMSG
jgi:hypothetical protein